MCWQYQITFKRLIWFRLSLSPSKLNVKKRKCRGLLCWSLHRVWFVFLRKQNIGVDTRNRAAAATISSLSLNPLGRQNLAGACPFSSSSCNCQQRPTSSNRAIHSVQQPPLRFLPHYSPPARRGGTEVRRRDCRQEGSRQESSRPLSMIGVPPVSINGYRGGDMPRSISSMSTTTPPPPSQSSPSQQQLQFDPYDLILPPPEEFCC